MFKIFSNAINKDDERKKSDKNNEKENLRCIEMTTSNIEDGNPKSYRVSWSHVRIQIGNSNGNNVEKIKEEDATNDIIKKDGINIVSYESEQQIMSSRYQKGK